MSSPGIILTGKNAGQWYLETLNLLIKSTNPAFEYHILQIDFDPINVLLPNNMKAAARLLQPCFVEMEQHKQPYILANITLHEAVQYFTFAPRYFISIDQILKKTGQPLTGTAAILGTTYTMNHSYIKSLFSNLEFITLPESLQYQVDSLRKLYYYAEDNQLSQQVSNTLEQLNPDYFVIACTELSVAWNNMAKNTRWIDLPKLQCQRLLIAESNH